MRLQAWLKVLGILMALNFASCASSTLIKSNPAGATLYRKGQRLGTTPYLHTDIKISGSRTKFVLKKEGFQDLEVILKRNEEFEPAVLTGCFFLWGIPLLWVLRYDMEHVYQLQADANFLPKPSGNPNPDLDRELEGLSDAGKAELRRLESLQRQGAISQEEYSSLKSAILEGSYDLESYLAESLEQIWKMKQAKEISEEEFIVLKNRALR